MSLQRFDRAVRDFDSAYESVMDSLDSLKERKRRHPARHRRDPTPWGSIESIGLNTWKMLRALRRARQNVTPSTRRELREMESDWRYIIGRVHRYGFRGGAEEERDAFVGGR